MEPPNPVASTLARRIITASIDARWWLALVALVLGAAGAWAGRNLAMERSIETMFAEDDPILASYRRLQRTFGRLDVVLAVYADPELTSDEGVERLRALTQQLREVDGVVAVVSLDQLPNGVNFDDDGVGRRIREVFAGYTHNHELTAAGVLCLVQRPEGGARSRREILTEMREVVRQQPQGALVGEPVLIEEAFDLLENDGRRLNTWCTLLVMGVIVLCFRSVRWLLLPLGVVLFALHSTRGLLAVSGMQLSMVSSMLAAIITVCGVATVVHIMVHYLDGRRHSLDQRAALLRALDMLKAPIAFAILTDAAGFASLMISRVGPIHDFGLMMAIGAVMTLPACILLAPALTLAGDAGGTPPPERKYLSRGLGRMLRWSNSHAVTLAVGAVVLAVLAVLGSQRLERETAFTKNFRAGTPIIQAYDFVEDQFGGAGVWELLIPAPAQLDGRYLHRIAKLEEKLLDQSPGELTKAISLADAIRATMGNLGSLFSAPAFGLRLAVGAMRAKMPEFIDAWYATDPEDGRAWIHVLLRSPERLPAAEKIALIERVEATIQEEFPAAEATGYYVLLADLIDAVLADQWKTFGVAAAAVLAMAILAFRHVPLAVATMIPNSLPVLTVFGAMGWLGIKTNMGAAMIAAVSVGLSIDSSIHYVMLYQRRRREGASLDEALAFAQDSAGRAATLSTLALIVGFASLAVSDFIPTVYFGALVSLSMLGGLVGNILVLPMLIRKLDQKTYA